MERNEDQIDDNVLDGDFGGLGPRQILHSAMKDADEMRAVVVLAVGSDGELWIWHNEIELSDLAILNAKMAGFTLMSVNDWEAPE